MKRFLLIYMILCLVLSVGFLLADNVTGWNTLGGNNQRSGKISFEHQLKGCGYNLNFKKSMGDTYVYSPVVNSKNIIFGTRHEFVICLDRENGEEIWNRRFDGDSFYQTIHNDKVYFGDTSGMFTCLDIKNGKIEWQFKTNSSITSSPIIDDENIYFCSKDSNLYCLDFDGKIKWKFQTNGAIISSPVKSGNVIYMVSEDKFVYCISCTNGELSWKLEAGSPSVDDGHKSTPAIFDDKLFVGIKNPVERDTRLFEYKVICLDLLQKRILWQREMFSMAYSFAFSDNKLFTGCDDGLFFCLDIDDGEIVWEFKTNFRNVDSPVADDKYVLVPS